MCRWNSVPVTHWPAPISVAEGLALELGFTRPRRRQKCEAPQWHNKDCNNLLYVCSRAISKALLNKPDHYKKQRIIWRQLCQELSEQLFSLRTPNSLLKTAWCLCNDSSFTLRAESFRFWYQLVFFLLIYSLSRKRMEISPYSNLSKPTGTSGSFLIATSVYFPKKLC